MKDTIIRATKGVLTKLSKAYRFIMGKSHSTARYRLFFRDNFFEGYVLTDLGRTKRRKKRLLNRIHDIIFTVVTIWLFFNISYFRYWLIPIFSFMLLENLVVLTYNNHKNLLEMAGDKKYVSDHYRLKFDDSVEDATNATPVIKVGMLFFYRDEDETVEDLYNKISVEEGYDPREIHEATADDSLDISRYFLPVAVTADMKVYPLVKPIAMMNRILNYENRHLSTGKLYGKVYYLLKNVRKFYGIYDRETNYDIYCDIGYISLQTRGSMIIRIKRRGLDNLMLNSRNTSQVRKALTNR